MKKAPKTSQILIVDDDEVILIQLEKTLNDHEFEVFSARNGLQALDLIREERPDLILLDRRMPEMDGTQTLIQLKADSDFADIPVIMLTGDNDILDMTTCFDIGATDYIIKPFASEDLIERVNKALSLEA